VHTPISKAQAESGVNTAIQKTFALLAASNHASVDQLLLSALGSSYAQIQVGALEALFVRRSAAGDRWILSRWHEFDERWRNLIVERAFSMTSALREAIIGSDLQLCLNACDLAIRLGDHDLIPALVIAIESPDPVQAQRCGETLLWLTADLRHAVDASGTAAGQPDLEPVRRNVLASLERYLKKFQRHKPIQPLEAYLVLVNADDEALRTLLLDSHDPAFVSIVYLMAHSEQPGVMRLLLEHLDDPQSASAALNAIGHRADETFIRLFLDHVGDELTETVRNNLRKIESFVWLRDDLAWLNRLDDRQQDRLVQVLLASSIKKSELFHVLEFVIQDGHALGRRAAAKALVDFSGTEASALTMRALEDDDPQVQAAAVSQLRQRGLSNTLSLLLDRLESPHHVVRQAARASLAEYSFKRYLASFDILNEVARRSTGKLVKRIDTQTIPLLREQFQADSRTRRLRAVAMAIVLELAGEFEDEAVELLADPDHVVRAEAARLLGYCPTPTAKALLQQTLTDASVVVREAAAASSARLEGRPAPTSNAGKGSGATEVTHA